MQRKSKETKWEWMEKDGMSWLQRSTYLVYRKFWLFWVVAAVESWEEHIQVMPPCLRSLSLSTISMNTGVSSVKQRAIPAILANANIIILCRCFCALYLKKIVDNNNSINQCYCSYCYFVSTSLLWLLAIRQTLLCFLVIFSSVLFCVCTRTYANVCVTDSQWWQWYLY